MDEAATKNTSPSVVMRLWRNDWLRAFVFALGILLLLHLFVVRFVSAQSTSMFSTLRPGDLLLVKRWTRWTGADPGDIVVFRDPLKDHQPLSQRPLMVKRVVAGPGDKMEIRRGRLLLNGKPVPDPEGTTYSYLVRLRAGAAPETLLQRLGLPLELAHGSNSNLELPLNGALAARAKEDADVVSVSAMRLASGARPHVFPFSPRYPWNGDDYGPVTVPAAGDTLHINVDNLPLYDRLMSVYEGHRIGANGSQLTLDDAPLEAYVVQQDYYFVLGDSRHFSADSRYWGFLPADHVVGSGGIVLLQR